MADENRKEQLRRKFLSLEDKIQILNRLKDGEKVSSIANNLKLNESTIRTIKRNENKIRKSVAGGSSISAKRVARVQDIDMIRMEKALMVWFEDCVNNKIPLNGNIIKQKALRIYKHLKHIGHGFAEQQASESFTASDGWLRNLKKRFFLYDIKFQGEQASTDAEAARIFTQEIREIVERGKYKADQIFNADETTLYLKRLPSRTWRNERHVAGFKTLKNRITLLMCSNAAGSCLLKPLVIHHSLQPKAMKGQDISQLPVFWRSNNKAGITTNIFTDWFHNCFVPSVENHMQKKNLSFKAVLLVDNATSHNKELSHPNIKVVFLPPSCTSLIQPLDQGIIHAFKAIYLRQTYEIIDIRLKNDKNKTDIEAWKEFCILDCINIISSACEEIGISTLNAGWRSLLPEMVNDGNAIPSLDEQYTSIINAASHLNVKGLADMTIEDAKELFQHQSLSEEDLIELIDQPASSNTSIHDNGESINDDISLNININCVEKIVEFGKQFELCIFENDPSIVRNGKSRRELQRILLPYQEFLAENKKEKENDKTSVPATNLIIVNNECITKIDEHSEPLKKKKKKTNG